MDWNKYLDDTYNQEPEENASYASETNDEVLNNDVIEIDDATMQSFIKRINGKTVDNEWS